jgi:hypothetical protein
MVLGWLPRIANSPFSEVEDPRIASWGISAVPAGLIRVSNLFPGLRPGLLSAVPPGLNFERVVRTQTSVTGTCPTATFFAACKTIAFQPMPDPAARNNMCYRFLRGNENDRHQSRARSGIIGSRVCSRRPPRSPQLLRGCSSRHHGARESGQGNGGAKKFFCPGDAIWCFRKAAQDASHRSRRRGTFLVSLDSPCQGALRRGLSPQPQYFASSRTEDGRL